MYDRDGQRATHAWQAKLIFQKCAQRYVLKQSLAGCIIMLNVSHVTA